MGEHGFSWRAKALLLLVWAGFLGLMVLIATGHHDGAVDFATYYRTASALRAGTPIYAADPAIVALELPYVYPPLLALLIIPLTWLAFPAAAMVWLGINVLALLIGLRLSDSLLAGRPRARLALWLLPPCFAPVFLALLYGQVTPILFALAAGVWIAVELDRPRLAGWLLALAAWIKVYPVVMVLYFGWTRRWRVVGWTFVAGLVLGGVQLALTGQATIQYVSEVLPRFNAVGQPALMDFNQSIFGFATRLWTATSHSVPLAMLPELVPLTRLLLTVLLVGASVAALGFPASGSWPAGGEAALGYVLFLLLARVIGSTLGVQGMIALLLGYAVFARAASSGSMLRWAALASLISVALIDLQAFVAMGLLGPGVQLPWWVMSAPWIGLLVAWGTGVGLIAVQRQAARLPTSSGTEDGGAKSSLARGLTGGWTDGATQAGSDWRGQPGRGRLRAIRPQAQRRGRGGGRRGADPGPA